MASPAGSMALAWERLAFEIGATVAGDPTGSLLETVSAAGEVSDSLEARFELVAPDVRRLCRQLLGDPDAAGEAVAEVFLRAGRAWASYDAARPFRPWILAVASHYCIDRLRRESREARLFEPGEGDVEAAAAPGLSPLRRLLEAERHGQLQAAVEALPPRYRAPLVLRFHAELSYDEIAARLGLHRAQVGTLLLRARRKLREALAEEGS
jgi:RNA polymerase sigma factor (sigma-70 family)